MYTTQNRITRYVYIRSPIFPLSHSTSDSRTRETKFRNLDLYSFLVGSSDCSLHPFSTVHLFGKTLSKSSVTSYPVYDGYKRRLLLSLTCWRTCHVFSEVGKVHKILTKHLHVPGQTEPNSFLSEKKTHTQRGRERVALTF